MKEVAAVVDVGLIGKTHHKQVSKQISHHSNKYYEGQIGGWGGLWEPTKMNFKSRRLQKSFEGVQRETSVSFLGPTTNIDLEQES